MVQKQTIRTRSKSATRPRKSEALAGNVTITRTRTRKSDIINTRKSEVLDNLSSDNQDKSSDESIVITRRVTRQYKKIIEPENSAPTIIDAVSDDEIDSHKIVESRRVIRKTRVCSLQFGIYLLSILIILVIPFGVLILNKIAETRGKLTIQIYKDIKLDYFLNWRIFLLYSLWLKFLAFLAVLPVGWVKQSRIGRGTLKYRCNGAISLILTTAIFGGLYHRGILTTKMIYDNYYHIIASSIIVALCHSFFVLIKSYLDKSAKICDDSSSFCMGFILGREINPRFFGLDLRFFYEFRPGFIGWALLNVVFCLKDLEANGYRSINPSLLLIAVAQYIYCLDALAFEGDVISKSFMISGRFGLLHCMGNSVIVPFLFSLTSRTVQLNGYRLPFKCLVGIVVLNIIGYIIYRSSNWQKNNFRANPYNVHLTHLKTITNDNGQQLLVGGWWGLLRHPNYLGDIIMSLCWSLYSGIQSTVCWLYPIYFLLFIISRCLEDETNCQRKHGKTWEKYKIMVRYRLVPFLF